MLLNIYAIYDKVAEEALMIQTAKNDGLAVRLFLMSIRKQARETEGFTPDDYALYHIGSVDLENMSISAEKPVLVPFTEQIEDEK